MLLRFPSHTEAPTQARRLNPDKVGVPLPGTPVGVEQRAGPRAGLAASVPADTWCPPSASVPGQGGCSGRPRQDMTGWDGMGRDAGGAATSERSIPGRRAQGLRTETPKAEMEPPPAGCRGLLQARKKPSVQGGWEIFSSTPGPGSLAPGPTTLTCVSASTSALGPSLPPTHAHTHRPTKSPTCLYMGIHTHSLGTPCPVGPASCTFLLWPLTSGNCASDR